MIEFNIDVLIPITLTFLVAMIVTDWKYPLTGAGLYALAMFFGMEWAHYMALQGLS